MAESEESGQWEREEREEGREMQTAAGKRREGGERERKRESQRRMTLCPSKSEKEEEKERNDSKVTLPPSILPSSRSTFHISVCTALCHSRH
jgi:hypothetical protein